jgi:hypothetical protein
MPVPGAEEGNSFFFWLFETEDAAYDDNLIGKEACHKFLRHNQKES